jgi:hypothetical protein
MEAVHNIAMISALLGLGFFLVIGIAILLMVIWAAGEDR